MHTFYGLTKKGMAIVGHTSYEMSQLKRPQKEQNKPPSENKVFSQGFYRRYRLR